MKNHSFPLINSTIFEINTQPQLVYFNTNRETPQTPQILHTHQEIAEILFVEQGKGSCTIGNHTYRIKENDLLLISSGILHCTSSDPSADMHTCLFGIKNLHLKGLPRGQLLPPKIAPILPATSDTQALRQIISLLEIFSANAQREAITEAANHLTQSLLAVIFDLAQNSSETAEQGQDYNLGLRIKEYIDEHYLEDLNLASIAEGLHVNVYYLSHTFKKLLGYSPIQYVIQRRIGEAQNLLLTTDLTVTEIALRCGYNNSNYFQSVFNNLVGMPPGKYRKTWGK